MKYDLNLNNAKISNADGPDVPIREAENETQIKGHVAVEVVFDRLATRMVNFIRSEPVIIGCLAWLTNRDILATLATRQAVSIIVQKEDFLRPDAGNWSQEQIRRQYKNITGIDRWATRGSWATSYNTGGDSEIEAIRCCGVAKDRREVPPRMHHKFLVACDLVEAEDEDGCITEDYIPKAVWTGSFNATENATRSLENAVILHDSDLAQAFFLEWSKILGLSEPLDWTSHYVEPEYRIGT